MSIEEAYSILNEVVITEPCIHSSMYISVENINSAIQTLLSELYKKDEKIKELKKLALGTKLQQHKQIYANTLNHIHETFILNSIK